MEMKAELFLEHNGVKIWHAYKDGYQLSYWYSTKCYQVGRSDIVHKFDFDVRELDGYNPDRTHAELMREAIKKGALKNGT